MITREPDYFPPTKSAVQLFGRQVLVTLRNTGRALQVMLLAFIAMPYAVSRRNVHTVVTEMYVASIKSLGVITIVGLFTGMILALHTGLALRDYGQEANVGTLVMVVMIREMGPFMTGLIIAASVGSAIAAQVGTMTVSEEVAALEVMSIDPVRFIVMPRMVALMLVMPMLTVYTNIIGVCGGGIVGMTQLGVPWEAYFDNALRYAQVRDLYVGLLKATVFGVIITTVACHQGFHARGGAVGVGRGTRQTVIVCFLTILVVGYIMSGLFYR